MKELNLVWFFKISLFILSLCSIASSQLTKNEIELHTGWNFPVGADWELNYKRYFGNNIGIGISYSEDYNFDGEFYAKYLGVPLSKIVLFNSNKTMLKFTVTPSFGLKGGFAWWPEPVFSFGSEVAPAFILTNRMRLGIYYKNNMNFAYHPAFVMLHSVGTVISFAW